MKGRVERLQWGLVAGTLALLAVLVGAVGYSRWKAAKGWLSDARRHAGVNLQRETDGFTYSQSMQGRTVFSLHAAKAFQHESGNYTLHDVVLTVYGLKGDRADRIYGNEFDWDEPKGVARAQGEVRMDLGVPAAAALAARGGGPAAQEVQNDPRSIHVKTSGVVFLRKLDVVATNEAVEFHYGALTCMARGAELDSNPSALHLLADVHVEGEWDGEPAKLTAAKADFDRAANVLTVAAPVLDSGERHARAAQAVLHLRPEGTVETGTATGGVEMVERTRRIRGERLEAVVNERNQPVSAKLAGGVELVDTDAARPAQGKAAEMRVRFGAGGVAEEVTALGGVQMTARERAPGGAWLQRAAQGDQMVAGFAAVQGKGAGRKAELRTIHASGRASMRTDGMVRGASGAAGGVRTTSVVADDLLANFVRAGEKQIQPTNLHGTGHVQMHEAGPGAGEERTSQSDLLDVRFAPGSGGALEVAGAEQTGHVSLRSVAAAKTPGKAPVVSTGSADRAVLDKATQKVVLTGNARVGDAGTSLSAAQIAVDQATGDAEATGGVTGTLVGGGAANVGAGPQGSATHVAASRAVLKKSAGVATFEGEAGKPARMWQEASQVEAAVIVVDDAKRTLVARPNGGGTVKSVFAGERGKAGGEATVAARLLRVESRSLQYTEAGRQATFEGPVRMETGTGEVRGARATVFFVPAAGKAQGGAAGVGLPAGGLERAVVNGAVRLHQPGRDGTGDQLVYKAADGSVTLTGSPGAGPRVVDAQQGTVTGASLMLRPGDSTIVVSGAQAAGDAAGAKGEKKPARARIDTRVRQ